MQLLKVVFFVFQFVFSSNHDFRAKRKCFFTSIENESQNGTPNNFLTPNVYKLMWKREAKSNSNIVFYFHRTKIWCSGNPWSCSARRKRCALNHWGRAKTPNNVAQCCKYFLQSSTFTPKRPNMGASNIRSFASRCAALKKICSNMGRQTCFLPRAPSILGTPMALAKRFCME